MRKNVADSEIVPRIGLAFVAAAGAAWAQPAALKAVLFGVAAGMLTTVAIGYCPVTALREADQSEQPTWRTLKTYRVEA